MKILFSTLYGSQLYGYADKFSDRDVKHIVLPSLRDALLGKVPKNKVKKKNKPENVKNTAEDTDEEYIPIQVFAKDVMEGQTYALELVYAVEYSEAEQEIHDKDFLTFCRELRSKFRTSNMTAMIGYAVKQATLYSSKGERLNATLELKTILQSFEPNDIKMDGIWLEVIEKVSYLVLKYPTYIEITEYAIDREGTMRPCIRILERTLPASATFEYNLKTVQAIIDKYGDRAKAATLDNVDWKAISHALRIINEGITLLLGKSLIFPYDKDYCNYLLSIKRGELDYELVKAKIEESLNLLKSLEQTSTLPPKSFELTQQLEDWLYNWLTIFYETESDQVKFSEKSNHAKSI